MKTVFDETMSMDAIMRTWPGTIDVMLKHQMLCVGCPVAPFHTVSDACREHGVNKALFVQDILQCIGSKGASP